MTEGQSTKDWLDRLIDSVGLPLLVGGKQKLLKNISFAQTWYHTHQNLQAHHARILQLENSSKALIKARNRIADVWDEIAGEYPPTLPEPNEFLDALQRAIEFRLKSLREVDRAPDAALAKSIGRELALNSRSSFEAFCGRLDEIYSEFFGRHEKYSRGRGGKAAGPRIRFISGCLLELGITKNGRPYSDESIAKAIQDKRSGRPRQSRRGAKKTFL